MNEFANNIMQIDDDNFQIDDDTCNSKRRLRRNLSALLCRDNLTVGLEHASHGLEVAVLTRNRLRSTRNYRRLILPESVVEGLRATCKSSLRTRSWLNTAADREACTCETGLIAERTLKIIYHEIATRLESTTNYLRSRILAGRTRAALGIRSLAGGILVDRKLQGRKAKIRIQNLAVGCTVAGNLNRSLAGHRAGRSAGHHLEGRPVRHLVECCSGCWNIRVSAAHTADFLAEGYSAGFLAGSMEGAAGCSPARSRLVLDPATGSETVDRRRRAGFVTAIEFGFRLDRLDRLDLLAIAADSAGASRDLWANKICIHYLTDSLTQRENKEILPGFEDEFEFYSLTLGVITSKFIQQFFKGNLKTMASLDGEPRVYFPL